ncbi:hypothetical protein JW707_03105 [Candidatus Woesearchaeota archaeon]|nr:hypothetical protein [Candidatus Woesearchaeota archaeon]
MSDIEKVMKINKMSAYLKQHGFASSSDEAASKAQEVFDQKLVTAEKPKEGGIKMADDEKIAKIERNFDVFKATTAQQLNSLKDDVHNVVQKMNEIIKTINELEKLKESVTTIDEDGEKQQRLAPKVIKKPKEEKPKNHPRSGNMQPGDIDLNKTFYFGKR